MLRLERCDAADSLLTDFRRSHTTVDAQATSSMLLAMAHIRRGMPGSGQELLEEANWQFNKVHPSIRSEIALYEAYAFFAKRDIASALQAIAKVEPGADIIHARALQLQGFCHSWLGRKREAGASFVGALARLDTCRLRDDIVGATALAGLSVIGYELNDRRVMQLVEDRYSSMQWPLSAARFRHQIEISIAYHADFIGDNKHARDFALKALQTGEGNLSLQIGSYSQLARIEGHSYDVAAAKSWLDAAWRCLNEINDRDIQGVSETTWAVLEFIRESALYDLARSRGVYSRYKTLRNNSLTMYSGGLQNAAGILFTEGFLSLSGNDITVARQCFLDAFKMFRTCDFTPEATESAYWLTVLGDESVRWYITGTLAGISNWMTRINAVKL
jgi:hypothetical protein